MEVVRELAVAAPPVPALAYNVIGINGDMFNTSSMLAHCVRVACVHALPYWRPNHEVGKQSEILVAVRACRPFQFVVNLCSINNHTHGYIF